MSWSVDAEVIVRERYSGLPVIQRLKDRLSVVVEVRV